MAKVGHLLKRRLKMENLPKFKVVHVAVSCDFSHSSFELAHNLAKEYELGEFRYLIIGPEDKFIAQELLHGAPAHIGYDIAYNFDSGSIGNWIAIFKNGMVIGQSA